MKHTMWSLRTVGVIGLLATGGAMPLGAAEILPPPFGLHWGDAPGRLVDWAARTKLDQLVKTPANDPSLKIFMFSSPDGKLPDHEASTLEARYLDGRLYEVTLHYRFPGVSADVVRGKFIAVRDILTRRHGSFKPFGWKDKDDPRDGIAIHSQAYRIDPASGRWLLLALTEVVDEKRGDAAARFSVVYHNSDVLNGSGERIVIRRDGVDVPEGAIDAISSESPAEEASPR